jgi:PhnB protein
MPVKAIPDRFNTVSAYLVVPNAEQALEFYSKALGAETICRMPGPGGQGTMHAEMGIGNSTVMLTDENPQWQQRSPNTLGGTPVTLHVYTTDCDSLFNRAVAAGCAVICPPMDMFWGDRYAKLTDPYGHVWGIATHKEDVPPEEMPARMEKAFAEMSCGDAQ